MKIETIKHSPNREIESDQAIKLFTQIRDIPYALGSDGDIEQILIDNKGGCARKHMFLLPKLRKLGYKVELGLSQFDWRELPIPYEILKLLKQPIQHHMFLYVNGAKVDATWDNAMKKLDFPVYDWDGKSATGLTVNGQNTIKINATTIRCRSAISSILKQIRGESNQITLFNDAFNEWLINNR